MHELMTLAHQMHFVTSTDAAARGYGRNTLRALSSSGQLVHVCFGVYLLPEKRTPEAQHALMTAALLHLDPYSVASHQSALAILGVALYGVPLDQAHLADARRSSCRRERVHRHVLRDGDVVHTTASGLRVIEPALATLQVAAAFGPSAGIVGLDSALHAGLCTPEDLDRVLESGRIRRGLLQARYVAEHADRRAKPPGESLLRGIVAAMPWPYDLQVNVGGPGAGYRVDLLVADRVVLEFDGDVKYQGADGPSALIGEKRREDFIRGLGFEVIRVTWPQLRQPAALRRLIHEAIVRARAARAAA